MLITETIPEIVYTSKNKPGIRDNINNYKSGQRKLLITEIQFLTLYSHLSTTVVYVGSAPGHHLNILIGLFPNIKKWIFFDPSETRVKEGVDIEVHKRKFTIEDAIAYCDHKPLFISDIRGYETQNMGKVPIDYADSTIQADMDLQKEWVNKGQFVMSSLKFRLPWKSGIYTKYFGGLLYTTPWLGEYSPELRLFTTGKTYKQYEHKKIDNQMYWYNTVKRREIFQELKDKNYLQVDYDQLLECQIVRDYLQQIQKKNESSLDSLTYLFINLNCLRFKPTYRS